MDDYSRTLLIHPHKISTMNIKEQIREIENIQVEFDISLAEKKLNKIDSLLSEIENLLFKDVCKILLCYCNIAME